MEITKLIIKKIKGQLSPQEQEDFERWLAKEATHKCVFCRLKNMEMKQIDIGSIDQLNEKKAWIAVLEKMSVLQRETLISRRRDTMTV